MYWQRRFQDWLVCSDISGLTLGSERPEIYCMDAILYYFFGSILELYLNDCSYINCDTFSIDT